MKCVGQVRSSGGTRKKNVRWMFVGFVVLFLLGMSGTTWTATLDREGYNPDCLITDSNVIFKGHDFAAGSTARTYFFETHATYKEFYKGKLMETFPIAIHEKVVWDGSSHHLSVHATQKDGYHTDTVYQCGKMDPLLTDSAPICKQISSETNWKGPLSVVWGEKRSFIEQLRDSMSGRRKPMVWEALAKSMRINTPGKIKTPPGSILLTMKYATDVPVPEGWTADFFVFRAEGYPTTIKDYYGHTLKFPRKGKLLNGNTFCGLQYLPPGTYSAYTRMMTSLTTTFDSKKVFFKVVPSSSSPKIVAPKEKEVVHNHPIFRILAGTDYGVALQIEYSRNASANPYELYKEIDCQKPDWTYQKASHVYGAWVSLLLEGDYRARAAYENQGFQEVPQWSPWRHFHVGSHRKLQIVLPKQGGTYTDKIPCKILLPDTQEKGLSLTLTWTWTEAPSPGGAHHFSQPILLQSASGESGGTYKLTMTVERLLKWKKKRGIKGIKGQFGLVVKVYAAGYEMASCDFTIPQPGEPVSDEQGKKKDLSYHMKMPVLKILPLKFKYRVLEPVDIRVKNAPKKEMPFEVHYRPDTKHRYKSIRRLPHHFTATGNITTLHLKFEVPGQYQVRVRPSPVARWRKWHPFEVSGAEKPVTVVRPKVARPKIHLAAPIIQEPRNNQVFLLTGKEVWVRAKIQHAAGARVALAVQHAEHNHFVDVKFKTRRKEGKTGTSVDILISKTGTYQVRAKLTAPGALWSAWRGFKVDKINRKILPVVHTNTKGIKKVSPPSGRGIKIQPPGIKIK